jgi:hypothetical protein
MHATIFAHAASESEDALSTTQGFSAHMSLDVADVPIS